MSDRNSFYHSSYGKSNPELSLVAAGLWQLTLCVSGTTILLNNQLREFASTTLPRRRLMQRSSGSQAVYVEPLLRPVGRGWFGRQARVEIDEAGDGIASSWTTARGPALPAPASVS